MKREPDKHDIIRLIWLSKLGYGHLTREKDWLNQNDENRKLILMRAGWAFEDAFEFADSIGAEEWGIELAAMRHAAKLAEKGNKEPQKAVVRDMKRQLLKSQREKEKAESEAREKAAYQKILQELVADVVAASRRPTPPAPPAKPPAPAAPAKSTATARAATASITLPEGLKGEKAVIAQINAFKRGRV